MKPSARLMLLIVALVALTAANARAAKNWTWYIDFTNTVQGSPGYIDVVIAVRANTPADVGRLGNTTIRGTMSSSLYDFGAGHDPALQTNPLTNYSMTVGNPIGTLNWQRNCTYNGDPGSGAEVTVAGILVTTIRFYIQNPGGASTITLGALQQTYEDDNTTNVVVTYDNSGGDVPLPIQMTSMAVSVIRDNDVEVSWKTASETNNYGFEIYRRRGESGGWEKIGFVEGHGTTVTSQSYSHVDRGVVFGKYSYQIRQIDLDGKSTALPGMDVTVGVASGRFTLAQNYPNPFNPSTVIEFTVPKDGHATVKVYNICGQEVATLFDGNAETGKIYTARFNDSNLAGGMYFYRLQSSGKTETRRMILMK
jgi:hypothetical protein